MHAPVQRAAAQGWLRPAGQADAPATSPPAVDVGPDGRITGVDGMLDQIGEALGKQASRILREDVFPFVLRDSALQRSVARGIGEGLGAKLAPWVALGAVSLAVLAGVGVYRVVRPRRGRRRAR